MNRTHVTEAQRLKIVKLLGQKLQARTIAERFGLHESTVLGIARDIRRNAVLSEALSK